MNESESPILDADISTPTALTELLPVENEIIPTSTPPILQPSTPSQSANPMVTEQDRVFTFLGTCHVRALRPYCKEYNVLQKGSKSVLQKRLFHKLCNGKQVGTIWNVTSVLDESETTASYKAYAAWIQTQVGRSTWEKAPSPESSIETSKVSRIFTVHEFARLVVLLATNNELRSALLASGRTLTKEDLAQNVTRDAFWTSIVQPVFNDVAVRPSFAFPPELADTDCGQPPSCFREGADLKRHYASIRAKFTTAYENWSRSGQNSTSFVPFCAQCPQTGKLVAIGRKCYILFLVLRCNEPNERKDLLDFTLKTIPSESMVDSGESGATLEDAKDSRRKRKRLRDLGPDDADTRALLNEQLSKVKNDLRTS